MTTTTDFAILNPDDAEDAYAGQRRPGRVPQPDQARWAATSWP